MPLTRLAADAFGVVTICLIALFLLLGLFCILYQLWFRSRIRREGFLQLGYFNGPWIVRILLVFFAIWWALGEILRLSVLKGKGRPLQSLNLKWQADFCKIYIVSNLGFAEPGLFLTLVFLLQASLQRRDSGTLSRRWNRKTVACILLFCLPVFLCQLVVVLIGPKFNNGERDEGQGYVNHMPKYFTSAGKIDDYHHIVMCTYPLLSTIFLGLFASLLISYFLYIGARLLSLVINKGLQRRVYWLIFSVVGLLPMRVMFLGFSVLSSPGNLAFEALAFLAFLGFLLCASVGIGVLVYLPVADSLTVRDWLPETGMTAGGSFATTVSVVVSDLDDDNSSLIANQSLLEGISTTSIGRNSDASMKGGSISFRTMLKDAPTEAFEEAGLFPGSSQHHLSSPLGSPPFRGGTMIPLREMFISTTK